MAQEIERKFLISGEFKPLAYAHSHIVQGYICREKGRTVRIRIRDDKGFITIKGLSDAEGLSRFEWEQEIALADAQTMLKLCMPGVIDKVRYLVKIDDNHVAEVDEFRGENEGLVMAEVELDSPEDTFDIPSFFGQEVTGDIRYYNSMLTRNPYKNL